jgi:hypothetical protein
VRSEARSNNAFIPLDLYLTFGISSNVGYKKNPFYSRLVEVHGVLLLLLLLLVLVLMLLMFVVD